MKKNIWKKGIAISLTILLMCYIFFANRSKIVIPCVFHEITGLYCPGCGITRCLNALLHLNFYQAFRYNALVFVLLPFAVIYVLIVIYCKITKKENVILDKIPNYVWWILVVITLIFGILRNLPYFDWLAPTIV